MKFQPERPHKEGDFCAQHSAPVWRDRADFIIKADISENTQKEWEQLWVRKLGDYQFQICCIPFFVYDLALGDHVETDQSYVLKNVTQASGHYTFRVWLKDSPKQIRELLIRRVEGDKRFAYEYYSDHLLAVDAAESMAQELADTLDKHEKAGDLKYETGRSRSKGSG